MFTKQLKRHIFIFPMKNVTVYVYFKRLDRKTITRHITTSTGTNTMRKTNPLHLKRQ